MIILIPLLFFGGIQDIFLVDKFDKGIKQFVIDKEIRDELLVIVKDAKKDIKAYYKLKDKLVKEFIKASTERNTNKQALEEIFKQLEKETEAIQQLTINTRLEFIGKIKEAEWTNIINLAEEDRLKKQEKEAKKAAKKGGKNSFDEIRNAINDKVSSESNRSSLTSGLQKFEATFQELVNALYERNSVDNEIIRRKDATKDELQRIASHGNEKREKAVESYLIFRTVLVSNTDEMEYKTIIKLVNKIVG